MFNIRSITNGNPFENDVDDEIPSNCSSAKVQKPRPFIRIPVVIFFTVIVFILLIAGTAATTISFPPATSSQWNSEGPEIETALDGNYKLIGPLLLTSGLFLLVVDIILCTIVTKDAYISSRSIQPASVEAFPKPGQVSMVGGPFYLATPNPSVANPNAMMPFAFSRQLWTMPNAPTPDFTLDEETMKGSKLRAATATLEGRFQPPYNPDVKPSEDT